MIDSDCYLIKCCIQFQCHYSNRSPVPRNSVKLGTGNGVQSGTVSGSKPGKKKNSVKNHSAIEGSGEGPIKPSVGDVESSVYDDDDVDVATSFSVPISLRSWRRRVPPGIERRDAGRIFRLRLVLFLKLQKEGTTTTAPTIAKKKQTNSKTKWISQNFFKEIHLVGMTSKNSIRSTSQQQKPKGHRERDVSFLKCIPNNGGTLGHFGSTCLHYVDDVER